MIIYKKSVILIFLFISSITPIFSQNQVIPGNVRIDATLQNISILWEISGDNNLNSSLTIEFRPISGGSWMSGAVTMRAHPNIIVNGSALGMNYHAGSVMFLEVGEQYEIRLIVTDSDGGGETRMYNVTTKTELEPSPSGTDKYVIPGNGGGSGTISDPYKGLKEAANNANPGDFFHVAAGIYDTFSITTSGTINSPIVFQGPENDTAFIDGAGTTRGVVTIGNSSDSCGYIIIKNFVISNGNWGIDAQNTHNILFKNNIVRNVSWGYCNRRENGWEHDQMLSDNIFEGITSWPGSGIPSERGIDIHGNNNIICYNKISYFGDGISTDIQPYGLSYSMDVFNNDISYCVDDPIEVDGTVANTRVWRNRVSNSRMGISLAPIFGGPCYIFRNEFFNIDYSIYKMNRQPSGLIIIHNTACKLEIGTTSDAGWQNTYFRNNILLSTEYIFEEYNLVSGSLLDDWDYDALGSTRAGTSGEPWFKWDNIRYADLSALQSGAGIELNGIAISFSDLINAILPTSYGNGVIPGSYDLSLIATSNAIDSGEILSNINNPFVVDGKPDCGAFEYGQPFPHYGPRYGIVGIEEGSRIENSNFLFSIKPNPFNLICKISIVEIPVSDIIGQNITLNIIDITGRIVDKIMGVIEINGNYQNIYWEWYPKENISNGFYFARTINFDFDKKIILIR